MIETVVVMYNFVGHVFYYIGHMLQNVGHAFHISDIYNYIRDVCYIGHVLLYRSSLIM